MWILLLKTWLLTIHMHFNNILISKLHLVLKFPMKQLEKMRSLKYSCGECEYVAITQIYVKRHQHAKHENGSYSFDLKP